MLKQLKDHFIPHEGNDHQPHFLRLKVVAGLLGLVLVLEGIYLVQALVILPKSDYFAAVLASVLVDETNTKRAQSDLLTLSTNPKLETAAALKAADMATKGYFAHNAPDGKTPWYWFELAGYDYAAAGENLAVNFTDSRDVTTAWMNSPTHRANIMSGNYTEIGIATAIGTYKGKEAIFVVQEFGRPSLIARAVSAANDATVIGSTPVKQQVNTPPVLPPTIKPVATIQPQPPRVIAPIPEKPRSLPTSSPATDVVRANAQTIPTTTMTVAGAETQKMNISDIAVTEPILERVHVGAFDLLLAAPRQTTNAIYLILGAIVLIALGLAVFIKIRIQYPHIIANGVLLLAIIIALVMLNSALGFTQGAV